MEKNGRCVIIGGADIQNYEAIRRYLRADDFAVFCDSGLRHRNGLCLQPDLIVGDFDSHENPQLAVETIVLPREKDDTDTVYAAKEALRRGFTDFLLLGVIGGRFDHSLGNLSLLLYLDGAGANALLVDDVSEMSLVTPSRPARIPDDYAYFSLLNITGTASGITITGAKFPLTDAEITCDYQYGISNEVLRGETAEVHITQGALLLVRVR